ncbi:hypothetical protein P4O66_006844 [Electrophorus voltai]|uniref:Lines homolog 1 n=1 Tax=Electrophorus voltai TaxID=2609070 RepID=A0AAD8ZI48_9TELE|nr:hypothetical protein P4O66_006844 [Electrophorus voltai]
MDGGYSDLHAVFTVLQSGGIPGMTSKEFSSRISSAVSTLNTLMQSTQSVRSEVRDLICLFLTVIEKVIASQSSKSLPQNVKVFYEDIIKKLFGDISLMPELVHFLNYPDRFLSHLTAKCMTSFVVYDISIRRESNPVWTATLVETFKESGPGYRLDSCLWSSTHVIKGILNGCCLNKQELLMKLLAGFEPSLHSLYSELLSCATSQHTKAAMRAAYSSDLDITVCAFVDLLEALAAARMRHGVCSSIQRLMFLQASALLHLVDSEVEYFVKKRTLLLLKRCLAQRAGEEWALGEGHATLCDAEGWSSDILAMADAVLQAVDSGWLRRVSVKPWASFFGGNRESSADGEGKDAVMLRAVSLILIKCLELKMQHVVTAGASHAFNVQKYVMELLVFLQPQVFQCQKDTHNCSWISLVFHEQDDDMMESAKALTALYLYQKRLDSSDPEACNWGCNPHCHFILLLQSLFFDHTVLLDFLISSETCFLEYCVLYLKHLPENWQEFCNACSRIEYAERRFGSCEVVMEALPLPAVSGASSIPQGTTVTPRLKIDPQFTTSQQPGKEPVFSSFPRLVDYESSEESEEEEQNVLNPQTKSNPEKPVVNRSMRQVKSLSRSVARADKARTDSTDSLLRKVVLCLTELRRVISRLHTRGLFPYNPSSLLRLLMAVEAKGNL